MRFKRAASVAKSRVSSSGARRARSPAATASAVATTRSSGHSTSRFTSWRPKTTNTPTSSTTRRMTRAKVRCGATVPATRIVTTPTSSAAGASPPPYYASSGCYLLTGGRAFGCRRRQDALVHENRARDGRDVCVRLGRAPATTGEGRPTQRVALGGAEVHRARGRRGGARDAGRVLHRVGKIRLFGRDQVAQVRLHRGDVRLRLGVRELRDRDRGQDADDHDHDQELNERETLTVHPSPPTNRTCQGHFPLYGRSKARASPGGVVRT